MTDLFAGRSTDYDGSGAVQVATGPIITTLSGDLGAKQRHPVLNLYSRSDSADYVMTHQQVQLGREQVQLAPGDEFYFTVTAVEPDASIDLSFAVMSTGGGGVDQVARDAAAENATLLADFQATQPFSQVLTDSGRFIDVNEPYEVVLPSSVNANGDSMELHASRAVELASYPFIHNNSSHGGTKAAIDQRVTDLLTAMGRVGNRLRYGTEFNVLERQMLASPLASSSRTIDGVTYFLANTGSVLTGFDGYAAAAFWVHAAGPQQLALYQSGVGNDTSRWVNGVNVDIVGSDYVLPAGWSHVAYTVFSTGGYVSSTPRIYGIPSAIFMNALPVVSRNKMQIPVHTAPIIFN